MKMAKKKETKGETPKVAEKNEPKTRKTSSLGIRIDELQATIDKNMAKIDSLKEELATERRKFDGLVKDNDTLHSFIDKITEENERQEIQIEKLSEIPFLKRLFRYRKAVKDIRTEE